MSYGYHSPKHESFMVKYKLVHATEERDTCEFNTGDLLGNKYCSFIFKKANRILGKNINEL